MKNLTLLYRAVLYTTTIPVILLLSGTAYTWLWEYGVSTELWGYFVVGIPIMFLMTVINIVGLPINYLIYTYTKFKGTQFDRLHKLLVFLPLISLIVINLLYALVDMYVSNGRSLF
jgi:hypothetical protein